jgi:hypothetical protein
MRQAILILIIFIQLSSFGQADSQLGINSNPKLNPEEIIFFQTLFPADSFDFYQKNIGFATNNGIKSKGFENSLLPISKKEYFSMLRYDSKKKLKYKLLILDSTQKTITLGFDAIIVVFDEKYLKKAEKCNYRRLVTVFGYRKLNYPDNLDAVGDDTSSTLLPQEASFLNQIFQHSRGTFDFTGQKVAIVRTQTKSIIPKSEFIRKVKSHLIDDFLYPYDFLYIFNDKEKKESGGFDAVIIYDCLRCGGRDAVAILMKNGT